MDSLNDKKIGAEVIRQGDSDTIVSEAEGLRVQSWAHLLAGLASVGAEGLYAFNLQPGTGSIVPGQLALLPRIAKP